MTALLGWSRFLRCWLRHHRVALQGGTVFAVASCEDCPSRRRWER